jgi:hypothetical protein
MYTASNICGCIFLGWGGGNRQLPVVSECRNISVTILDNSGAQFLKSFYRQILLALHVKKFIVLVAPQFVSHLYVSHLNHNSLTYYV